MEVSQAQIPAQSIQYQKGVGPHRARRLAGLGIITVEDACYLAPRRYEDRTQFVPIAWLKPGAEATLRARLVVHGLRRTRSRRGLVEARVQDATGTLQLIWFNAPYMERQLQAGQEYIIYGKVEERHPLQMVHPEIEAVSPEEEALHAGRIVPIYPLTQGVSQRWLRRLIARLVHESAEALEESLPQALLLKHQWPAVADAVRALHAPSSWDELSRARQRLAFEELLVLQLALAQRRARMQAVHKPQHYRVAGPLTEHLLRVLPFELTAAQQRVLHELQADLLRPHPMQRLLQGDVGCGKTVVMVYLMAIAVQSGYQAAVMAPTELLAEQHARNLIKLLEPTGLAVVVLAQGISAAQRRAGLEALAQGRAAVVVGTHALLQEPVQFKNLALVVIDEQHKFGVGQRTQLAHKAEAADVLVMSATPIPRTLALSLYGDLSISTIDALPPGRQPIRTYWIQERHRQRLYQRLRQELQAGRQGYVVYPLVEDRAGLDLKAATQMAQALQLELEGFRVGLLHGQMKPKEKEAAMRGFAVGEIHLLVSTVVIEVGIDVPNASIMIIEHAERFGLAQLHQLRGRIGRGQHAALCVLIGEAQSDAARQRLEAFVATADGFVLAEKDLAIRGPGELMGFAQHGWAPFRIADLVRDQAWLETAQREAEALVHADPHGLSAELEPLRRRLARFRQQAAAH
jgi:ATP-dependent DNA helicase RecG